MEYYFAGTSQPAWVGLKRDRSDGKLDATVTDKRHKCDDNSWKAVAAYAPTAGSKRAYQRSEDEIDPVFIDKRYKGNYWEDPAYAAVVRFGGRMRAMDDAFDNESERMRKDYAEQRAARLRELVRKNLISADACEPVWVGLKRGHERSDGKLDAAVMEKRHKCDDSSWKAVAAYAPAVGAKRSYQRSEDELDPVLIDKRYKGNYWEDPAYAVILRLRGGRKAMDDALDNRVERLIKELEDERAATLRELARSNLICCKKKRRSTKWRQSAPILGDDDQCAPGGEGFAKRYRLGAELGRRAFGMTRHCEHAATGEALTCKTTRRKRLRRAANAEDVQREVEILRRMSARAAPWCGSARPARTPRACTW
ncbi:hypothetical protein VPH35_050205 [Triticum aestivum]